MPTPTTRTGRASSASRAGRFTRSSSSTSSGSRGRYARSTATPRRSSPVQGLRRRRQPKPTGLKKVMNAVVPTGAGGAAKKAAPSSKKGKAGGLALVAAAAGMAFKNRDKLGEMRRKDSDVTPAAGSMENSSTPPATPSI